MARTYQVFAQAGQMRKAFGQALADLGAQRPDLVVLTCDVGWPTCADIFGAAHPERDFNLGIAEQNLMAAAAGLAAGGLCPVVVMFSIFASTRAVEQVRTSIAYPHLNVKIAGSYAGLSPEGNGTTHFALEDIAIMRAIAGMTILVPADNVAAGKLLAVALQYQGPVYLRLTRAAFPQVYDPAQELTIGRAVTLRQGRDVTIAATGLMVHKALAAADILAGEGISARVLDVHTIKPLDEEAIVQAARETGCIVTQRNTQ